MKNLKKLQYLCNACQELDKDGEYMDTFNEVVEGTTTFEEVLQCLTSTLTTWTKDPKFMTDKREYRRILRLLDMTLLLDGSSIKNMSNEEVLDRVVKGGIFNVQWFDKNPSLRRRICQRWNECVNNHGNKSEIRILKEKIDIIEDAMQNNIIS